MRLHRLQVGRFPIDKHDNVHLIYKKKKKKERETILTKYT